MKRSIACFQFLGFAVTALLGTLLHFLYGWLGDAAWIAPFSSVNESTFEHMKILFFPMLAYALLEYRFFPELENFFCVKLRGILLGILLIPIVFYTYNGVIGKSPDWINVSIFFLCDALAYLYEFRLFRKGRISARSPARPLLWLAAIALLFVFFTFATPHIGIFEDPLTGEYGI